MHKVRPDALATRVGAQPSRALTEDGEREADVLDGVAPEDVPAPPRLDEHVPRIGARVRMLGGEELTVGVPAGPEGPGCSCGPRECETCDRHGRAMATESVDAARFSSVQHLDRLGDALGPEAGAAAHFPYGLGRHPLEDEEAHLVLRDEE